jgi:lysozyme family protein
MTDAVDKMIAGILEREGGYVDHPSDPGGRTKYGITERVARANGYTGHMRNLPIEQAIRIYRTQYVERPGFLPIAEVDELVAEEVIDSGVNAGVGRAAKWFQQSLNLLNRRERDYADIAVDGQIGPKTMAAFIALRGKRGASGAQRLMLKALNGYQFDHYASLADGNTKFENFVIGWLDHRIGAIA